MQHYLALSRAHWRNLEMTNERKLSPEFILSELAKGKTMTEIADENGVTKQAVSVMLRRYGKAADPVKAMVTENFPWTVHVPHTQSKPYRYLRAHARYMVSGGQDMQDYEISFLRSFYKRLHKDNVVVEFDPALPSGFAYRERTPGDDNLIIRVNTHTNLTNSGKWIWTFPAIEP